MEILADEIEYMPWGAVLAEKEKRRCHWINQSNRELVKFC
jgi:hypothetical protein